MRDLLGRLDVLGRRVARLESQESVAPALLTGYALLAGRAGGQTLIGDTAASGSLVLRSTASATRGSINIENSVAVNLYYSAANEFSDGFNVLKRGNASDAAGAIKFGGELGYNSWYGWDGSAYFRAGVIRYFATEDWSSTTAGSGFRINTVTTGTRSFNARIGCDGGGPVILIATTTDREVLELRSPRTAIVTADIVSGIKFVSNDTSLATPGAEVASINAVAEATHTTTELKSALVFYTTTGTTLAEAVRIAGGGNVGIGTVSPSRKLHVAGTILVDGDEGGISGTIGLTDVSDLAARSTGVGTIKFDDATNRDSAGFVKIYVGTTAYYIPIFAAI